MCGIFGVVGGTVTPELIDTASHLLRHRGPDNCGSVRFDEGAFTHCRLAIIDQRALRRQYDTYCASSELGNSFFVWKFINLELWYRAFIVSGDLFEAGVGAQTDV